MGPWRTNRGENPSTNLVQYSELALLRLRDLDTKGVLLGHENVREIERADVERLLERLVGIDVIGIDLRPRLRPVREASS